MKTVQKVTGSEVSLQDTAAKNLINYVYKKNANEAPEDTCEHRGPPKLPNSIHSAIEICLSTEPLPADRTDLYILPVRGATRQWEHIVTGAHPVIAYGPPCLLPLAFDCGCCDYLREPWDIFELKARSLRLLPAKRIVLEWGTITFQKERLQVQKPQPKTLLLNPPEAAILRMLLLRRGTPVSRKCLQCALWDNPQAASRAVDVHISALRKKLNQLAGYSLTPHPIRSVYGYGYTFIHK